MSVIGPVVHIFQTKWCKEIRHIHPIAIVSLAILRGSGNFPERILAPQTGTSHLHAPVNQEFYLHHPRKLPLITCNRSYFSTPCHRRNERFMAIHHPDLSPSESEWKSFIYIFSSYTNAQSGGSQGSTPSQIPIMWIYIHMRSKIWRNSGVCMKITHDILENGRDNRM